MKRADQADQQRTRFLRAEGRSAPTGTRTPFTIMPLLAVLMALVAMAAACGPHDGSGTELSSTDNASNEASDDADPAGGDAEADADVDDADASSDNEDEDGSETDDGEESDDSGEAGSEDGSVPPDGPVVTVLDVGAEPRSELRIDIQAGDTDAMTLTQSQTIDQRIDGVQVPNAGAITTAATTDITVETAEDGVFQVTSITSGAEIVEAPSPGAAAQAEAAMAELIGIGNRFTVDDRGRVLASEPIGLDGVNNALVDELLGGSSGTEIASPLPDESVGIGARWEVVQRIPLVGLEIEQVLVYELVSIEGSVIELTVTGNQRVPAGSVMNAQGIPAEVISWDLVVSGTVTQDLTRMAPMSSIETSGSQVFQADGIEIEQDLITTATLEPL